MKIVEALWEKRNLGLDTVEFVIDNKDTKQTIVDDILNHESSYSVIKLPVTRKDLIFILQQDLGYTFIETTYDISFNLKKCKLNLSSHLDKFNNKVSYSKMDDNDLKILLSEIQKGIFTTDRIAINPKFGIEIANLRYLNWIRDELNTSMFYKIVYKDEAVGFFSVKKLNKDAYNPFLAGIYTKYQKSGLGFFIPVKVIELINLFGGNEIKTTISANNVDVFNIYMSLGFNIDNTYYVLEKIA